MKFFVIATLIALSTMLPAVAQMHSPPSMTPERVKRATAGGALQFTMRVDSVDRETVHGHILTPAGDETFAPSKATISLYTPQTAAFIMGKRDDLKPGAILFVYAVATKPGAADASKIVIDTQYVTVK